MTLTKTLAAAAALSLAALSAQAQETGFSDAAIQTGKDITTASQQLYDIFQGKAGIDGREALTSFIDGTSKEVTEFYQDTTAQFDLDFDRNAVDNTANGGLYAYAAAFCADMPVADDYKGQGLSPNVVIASFALQVSECLNAIDNVTNAQGIEKILSPMAAEFGISISDQFKQNVQPIDQNRMEAILFAVAYPHCVVNQEETACNIVRQSQPKQP